MKRATGSRLRARPFFVKPEVECRQSAPSLGPQGRSALGGTDWLAPNLGPWVHEFVRQEKDEIRAAG